jgi:hypothetical protein
MNHSGIHGLRRPKRQCGYQRLFLQYGHQTNSIKAATTTTYALYGRDISRSLPADHPGKFSAIHPDLDLFYPWSITSEGN